MKLTPTIKLIGNFTVSFIKNLTLFLLELFCIPITSKKNKQKLKVNENKILLSVKDIFQLIHLFFILNYKLCFF